jgi:hypothetical protein
MDSKISILLYIRRVCFRIRPRLVLTDLAMQNFAFAA